MFRRLIPPRENPYADYTTFLLTTHVCCTNCGNDYLYAECEKRYTMGKGQCDTQIVCPECKVDDGKIFDIHNTHSVAWFNEWRKIFDHAVPLPEYDPCPKCNYHDIIHQPSGCIFLCSQFKLADPKSKLEILVSDLYTLGTKRRGRFATCLVCLERYRVDYLHISQKCTVECPTPGCPGNLLDLFEIDTGAAKVVSLRRGPLENIPISPPRPSFKTLYPWSDIKGVYDTSDMIAKSYGGWDTFISVYLHTIGIIRRSVPGIDKKAFY